MTEIIVHCGLHKTGTTAVQETLRACSDALLAHGILFPRSGIPPGASGHHNLAWELSRDRRFSAAFGSLDSLIREIGSFQGKVVLSSEDFESSLLHPARWAPLVRRMSDAGHRITLLIYLRNPPDYLESLYVENLKHGAGEEFSRVLAKVVDSGRLERNEWEFCFDYARIREALTRATGLTVRWRDYDSREPTASIVDDFAHAVGIDGGWLSTRPDARAINPRLPLDKALLLFVKNRATHPFARQDAPATLAVAVAMLVQERKPRMTMPRSLRRSFAERFPGGAFVTEAAVAANGQSLTVRGGRRAGPRPGGGIVDIRRVFSFETQKVVDRLAALIRRAETRAPEDERMARIVAQWWRWVALGPDEA